MFSGTTTLAKHYRAAHGLDHQQALRLYLERAQAQGANNGDAEGAVVDGTNAHADVVAEEGAQPHVAEANVEHGHDEISAVGSTDVRTSSAADQDEQVEEGRLALARALMVDETDAREEERSQGISNGDHDEERTAIGKPNGLAGSVAGQGEFVEDVPDVVREDLISQIKAILDADSAAGGHKLTAHTASAAQKENSAMESARLIADCLMATARGDTAPCSGSEASSEQGQTEKAKLEQKKLEQGQNSEGKENATEPVTLQAAKDGDEVSKASDKEADKDKDAEAVESAHPPLSGIEVHNSPRKRRVANFFTGGSEARHRGDASNAPDETITPQPSQSRATGAAHGTRLVIVIPPRGSKRRPMASRPLKRRRNIDMDEEDEDVKRTKYDSDSE